MSLVTATRFQNCNAPSQDNDDPTYGKQTKVVKFVDETTAPTSQGLWGLRATGLNTHNDTANQPINENETFTLYGAGFVIPYSDSDDPEFEQTTFSVDDNGWKYIGDVQNSSIAERTFKVSMESFDPPTESEPGDVIGGFCWGGGQEDARYYNDLYITISTARGYSFHSKYLHGGADADGTCYYRMNLYVGGTLLQSTDYPGPGSFSGSSVHAPTLPILGHVYDVGFRIDDDNIKDINNQWPNVEVEIISNPTGSSLETHGVQNWTGALDAGPNCFPVQDISSSGVEKKCWANTGFGPSDCDPLSSNWLHLSWATRYFLELTPGTGTKLEVKFEAPYKTPGIGGLNWGVAPTYYTSGSAHGIYIPPQMYANMDETEFNAAGSPLTLYWMTAEGDASIASDGYSIDDLRTLTITLKVGGTTVWTGYDDKDTDTPWGTTGIQCSMTLPYDDWSAAGDQDWWNDNSENISVTFEVGGISGLYGNKWRIYHVYLEISGWCYDGIRIPNSGTTDDYSNGIAALAHYNNPNVNDTTYVAESTVSMSTASKSSEDDVPPNLYDRDYQPAVSGYKTNGFPVMQLGTETGFSGNANRGISTEGWATLGTAQYNSVSGSGGSSWNTRNLIALDTSGIDLDYEVLFDGTFKLIVNTTDEDDWPGTFMQPAGENSWMFTLFYYNTTTLGFVLIDRFWWEAGDSTDGYATYTLTPSATAQIAAVISGNEYQTTDRHVYLQTQAIPDGWGTYNYAGYTPGALCIPTEVISAETSSTGIELFGKDNGQTAAQILSDGNPDTYVRIKGKRKLSVMVSGPGIDMTNGMQNATDIGPHAILPRSAYSFWSTAVGANSKICDATIKTVSHDNYDIRLRWRYYKDDGSFRGMVNHKASGIDDDDLPDQFWGTTNGACPESIWNSSTHAGPSGLTPYHQDNMWLQIKGEENESLSYYFDVSSAYVLVKPLCVGNINFARTGLSFEASFGTTG